MAACLRRAAAGIFFSLLAGCASYTEIPVYYKYVQDDHKVLRGETLYSIAYQHGLDYRELAAWNRIAKPYTIYPGQRLQLKGPKIPLGTRTKTATAPKKRTNTKQPSPSTRKKTATAKPPKASRTVTHTWVWPVRGKVIQKYSPKGGGNKGIDIAGKPGQAILAASSGKVVYSGNGLPGYGNLIIVKHSDQYLSAYAHNRRLLVQEGRSVARGQKIAELGSTGARSPRLHFEIRRHGKPVNPLRYLPKL